MLFKCLYGSEDFDTQNHNLAMTSPNGLKMYFQNNRMYDLESAFRKWGKDKTRTLNYAPNRFLVDIPNKLIFNLLLEDDLPSVPTVYVDFRYKRIFFCNNPFDIKYRNSNNTRGWAQGVSYAKNTFFEWETDEVPEDEKTFCYEVPEDEYEELYKVLEPYILHDFNFKIEKLLLSFPDHRDNPFQRMLTSPLDMLRDLKEEKEKFIIDSDSEFWKFLIYDIFNGNLTNEYEKRFPRSVDKLRTHMARFQSHFLSTGNLNYDPLPERKN